MTMTTDPRSDQDGTGDARRGVIYARVSTADQATRGGERDGFSIPAQIEQCQRKAESYQCEVVRDFVERGESGTSTANRPALKEMLDFIETNGIEYVFVHKLDRLARNRRDDVEITWRIQQAGARLISCTENIDETASGMLLHGIMSSIAEFYSRNLATEVVKGMEQKARTGGTPGLAPLGYRNVAAINADGREIRTVDIDPERGPLITWAYQQYATGAWTLRTLTEALEAKGFTSRGARNRPGQPIRINSLSKLLRNPYYKGEVVYREISYPGRHEPLIDPQTWEQVQVVLGEHASGEKQREHPHYLKSSVFCRCGSRLVVTMAKNRQGRIYPYFMCIGRHQKRNDCYQKAIPIDIAESLVEDLYRDVQLTPEQHESVSSFVQAELSNSQAAVDQAHRELTTQKDRLLTERTQLLRAHYAGAVPLDLLKTEQDRIARQLATIETQMERSITKAVEIEHNLQLAMRYAANCHMGYMAAAPSVRRLYNQAFFIKIELGEDEATGTLKEPFESIRTAASTVGRESAASPALGPQNPGDLEKQNKPAHVDAGLKETVLVPPAGFEPAAFCSGGRRSIP